jgi:hypothetical protein
MQRSQNQLRIWPVALLMLLGISVAPAHATLPYKLIVSGPGIDGEGVIWLAEEEQTLEALQSGLLAETIAEPPSASVLPYKITWYLGRCDTEPAACREDPDEFTTHSTRYAYDAKAQRGVLLHLAPPDWFEQAPPDPESWYRTPPGFDRAIQRLLVLQGAPVDVFLPSMSIFPSDDSSGSMNWLIGVAVLIAALYLMRRGRTDR